MNNKTGIMTWDSVVQLDAALTSLYELEDDKEKNALGKNIYIGMVDCIQFYCRFVYQGLIEERLEFLHDIVLGQKTTIGNAIVHNPKPDSWIKVIDFLSEMLFMDFQHLLKNSKFTGDQSATPFKSNWAEFNQTMTMIFKKSKIYCSENAMCETVDFKELETAMLYFKSFMIANHLLFIDTLE
jgi:hypothetical protein